MHCCIQTAFSLMVLGIVLLYPYLLCQLTQFHVMKSEGFSCSTSGRAPELHCVGEGDQSGAWQWAGVRTCSLSCSQD